MRVAGGALVKRSAPKRYKAKDAPYAVGGNGGIIIAMRPRPYPKTAQQRRVGEAAKACGIKRGMKKSDLMTAMVDCIPGKFGKR
ncbi:MAG: hypothetical protein PHE59_04800 [Patescibacteria group bacterium]|mgnify:CR=1 FL=1|nr:hypothetical protein [Patescibacteria group bacterium]